MSDTRFLTFVQVSAKTACGRIRIYAGIAAGAFPEPIKFGKRSPWVDPEVEAWMQERVAERDGH